MRLRNIRIAKYYPRSGSYDFRYKSVAVGATDVVKVDFGGYLEKDSVVFKDRFGVPIKLNPQTNTLTFTAPQSADTNYIYAYDKTGERIGKLMVKTYAVKVYDVVLVRLKDSLKPDAIHANITFSADDLKNYLDSIYKQANVKFNVKVIDFAVENLLPFSHGDKRRFSGYNDDQKRILEAFDSEIKDNINYLFFLPAGAETSGVAGYNPFGYNFGFIYDGANMRTVAHELGHGIGSLHHPFDETVAVKGQTDNLMDYNDREQLWHFQWDMMQKPPKRIFKWRFEEGDAEESTPYNYLVNIFSPYYAQKILVNIEKYLNTSYGMLREGCMLRIFELLDRCYRDRFDDAKRQGIVDNISNKSSIDLEYLEKYNSTMVIYPGQKKINSIMFKLVCGEPDVKNTEEFEGIKPPYTVKKIKLDNVSELSKYMSDFVVSVFYNNLTGVWKKCLPQKINGKKLLEYNEIFVPNSPYYNQFVMKYRLTNGDIVMRIINGDEEEYMMLGPDNLWYKIYMSNYADDRLADEITEILTTIEVNSLQTVGRYVLPVEDAIILIDGKDFDGKESSRWIAGASLALDIIPGVGKLTKVFKLRKIAKVTMTGTKPVTKTTINFAIKEGAKETISEASKAFLVDVGSQFVVNLLYAFVKPEDTPLLYAISNINFVDKAVLSLNSAVGNYFKLNENNNASFQLVIACAEKTCMAFKNAQDKIRKGENRNVIKDVAFTCLFDLVLNGGPVFLANRKGDNRLSLIAKNWGKVLEGLKKVHPDIYASVSATIGNSFEQWYLN